MTVDEADPPVARRRRRRWSLWLGLGLVAAGLAVLGYVGWQLYGTNWLSQREHREIVDTLEQEWQAGHELARVDQGRAGAVLRVPRFGDDYGVPILEGISEEVLAAGVGHFPDSAGPGERGNYALAAHRVTHGEPFRYMPELEPGDEVIVETRTHVHTYVLDTGGDDLEVPFTQGWVVERVPVNPDPGGVGPDPDRSRLITLTTCSELFHTDNRLVAFGHLKSTERR